ncbi:3-deoxy-8-phosphooctulonate synthase [Streptomyces sp. XD-27]|nr:3-deoxy-8-phosphooctulonate synthase [Streptomyces sp. XD-27]WKX69371.1 3-deoxy-8-phosphooctulonate synthase [Streptomyces sp. XD-27]
MTELAALRRCMVAGIEFGNDRSAVILGGVNVLEDLETSLRVGEVFRTATDELGLPYVFKASFDKANRSSAHSFRGPGLDEGLAMLARIKRELDVPVVTDVHAAEQCAPAAEVADLLQIPAFLVRQTDLIHAAAATGRPLHLKKMQMMAPEDMRTAAEKCARVGAAGVVLCERGTAFGYHHLIVDIVGLARMREIGPPVTLDVTHALQLPGALGDAAGGRGGYAAELARAGVAVGLAGVFIEAHPDPTRAPCDGPSATALADVPGLLRQIKQLDDLTKAMDISRSNNSQKYR